VAEINKRFASGANVPKKKKKNPLESRKKAVKEAQRVLQMRIAQIEASRPRMEENDPDLLRPERQRNQAALSDDEIEQRVLLTKDWSRYQMEKYKEDHRHLTELVACRRRALIELRKASETLYQKAIALDKNIFPFQRNGPTATPPDPNYEAPDAEDNV
jgi:large subunit ribosomal protein L40